MKTWLVVLTLIGGNGDMKVVNMDSVNTEEACHLKGQTYVTEYSHVTHEDTFWDSTNLQSLSYSCVLK